MAINEKFREAALTRALRDIADGHLKVVRLADGQDVPDRVVIGAGERWWETLRERGLYVPPEHTGAWRLP